MRIPPKLLIVELWGLGDLVIATPFLRVGLARHFQDPAQFSQPVIHPGQLEADRVPLAQPVLNLLGSLPPAGLQPGLQFFEGVALHLWHGPATVLTLQQSGQPAGLECAHPIKKTAAANAQLLGNLRGGQHCQPQSQSGSVLIWL